MHYLYLIESEASGKYYIGQTADLQQRLYDHNVNRRRYTSGKGPWILIGYKTFKSRSEAVLEEQRLKKAKNKKYIYFYFKGEAYPEYRDDRGSPDSYI